MKILDKPNRPRGERIKIEFYHRAHLSLYPGTKVYLAVYPGRERGNPEIVGTAIHPSSWPRLLRLRVVLHDRAGGVDRLLSSIARHGGKLLYMDTASVAQETFHEIEVIVDFRYLFYHLKQERLQSNHHAVISDLPGVVRGLLLADCYDFVAWVDRRPRITVALVHGLARLHTELQRYDDVSALVTCAPVERGGWIRLPTQTLNLLRSELGFEPREAPAIDSLWYTITSDTNERSFQAHFLRRQETAVWCAIRHRSTPGSTAKVTERLARQGIDILTSLSRVEADKKVSWLEFLLRSEEWSKPSSLQPFRVLRELLAEPLRAIGGDLFFSPGRANRVRKSEQADEEGESTITSYKDLAKGQHGDWITDWIVEKKKTESTWEAARPRIEMPRVELEGIESLRAGVRAVERLTGRAVPQVFLSIAFSDSNQRLIDVVDRECWDNAWNCDVVLQTQDHPQIRQEVFSRIQKASHFLGVWTQSRHHPKSPSPWCLWELGIADALGKPAYVLIENRLESVDFQALRAEDFYYRFDPDDLEDFKNQVRSVLSKFVSYHPISPVFVGRPTDMFEFGPDDDPC